MPLGPLLGPIVEKLLGPRPALKLLGPALPGPGPADMLGRASAAAHARSWASATFVGGIRRGRERERNCGCECEFFHLTSSSCGLRTKSPVRMTTTLGCLGSPR